MNLLDDNDIYTAFHNYRNIGLDPLPIPYLDGLPSKYPVYEEWQKRADDNDFTAADFAADCNIGILLGGKNNVTDIDCDSPEAVAVSGDILMEKTGKTMMFGHESKKRSHYIFFTDKSLPSVKIVDPSDNKCVIEYRCVKQDGTRGVQTVFPPSVWCDPARKIVEYIELEEESAQQPAFVEAATLQSHFNLISAIALLAKHFPSESERHNTVLALAGTFAKAGTEVDIAMEAVSLAYKHSKGFNNDLEKVKADVKSVYRTFGTDADAHLFGYTKLSQLMPKLVIDCVLDLMNIMRPASCNSTAANEKVVIGITPGSNPHHFTDGGNGRRLVDKHADEIRFCTDEKVWYVWDGIRWQRDNVNRIRELAKEISIDIRHEAETLRPPSLTGDEKQDKAAKQAFESRRRDLLKWANQTENADRVSKTILSASSDPRITCARADFDAHSELLNCKNGILDLYTGELRPHDRSLMQSKLCPVDFDPGATHSVWEESLAAFTRNHPDLLPFLKTVAGYSIQGDKTEEKILVLYGPGSAGKGTFMDWLTSALGPDYACAMDANSVLKQKRDSAAASGDIARLEGKRIVVVSEIEKGSRMQESFMKQASGNDAMVARSLYQSEREFRPTHQFWFQSNYRPGVDSTDSGNRRRYIEIPFDNDLSTDPLVKFDPKLKLRMRQDSEFLKAVLAWAVAGCREWREKGLVVPESVKAATADFFAHNDFLNDFISEMCVSGPDEMVRVKVLTDAYKQWCEDQGEEPAQGRTFNRMMEERGFVRKQARVNGIGGKAWMGIRLKEHDELVSESPDLTPGLARMRQLLNKDRSLPRTKREQAA